MGAFADGDWDSLCKMLSFEEPEKLDQFYTSPSNVSIFDNQTSQVSHDSFISDLHINNFSDNMWCKTASYENSNHLDLSPCSHFAFPPEHESHMLRNDAKLAWPFSIDDLINEPEVGEDSQSGYLGSPVSSEMEPKRKYSAPKVDATTTDDSGASVMPKKKARILKNRGNKKNVRQSDEAEDISHSHSSTISGSSTREKSVDESNNPIQETSDAENSDIKETTMDVTTKGKKRASRGEATDPQSLYARRRRQRINERLRILQTLVPNGTKVDISTMLEEAVQYVKFLQLQIKLLSSDDLWMYAPLAYNGVDMNLYRNISPFLLD
ncbi:hypothetical protein vseg_012461 [Gypsophila vaccaria]